MSQGQVEIVVLKPTKVFFAFLISQLPQEQWPNFESLQTDKTAYVIPKLESDQETLHFLENHYPSLFRHEIARWLGPNARNPIEDSALDFLCCFKLEFHNHILLMEPSVKQGRQLLIIKPHQSLLDWIKSAIDEEEEGMAEVLEQVNLSHLVENATVLVKNFQALTAIKPFIQKHYQLIFETAMSRMSSEREFWPVVDSYPAFNHYFSVEIHTQLMHLS